MRGRCLLDRITIQQIAETEDPLRGKVLTPSTLAANVPAHVEPLTGREAFQAQSIVATLSHRVTLRYREDVTQAMRVVFKTQTFEILTPPVLIRRPRSERRTELLCGVVG